MSEGLNQLVATIRKNAREELRVSLAEYKGAQFVDLRIYAEISQTTDARSPTKAGVTVSFANLPALRKALDDAEVEARALGLMGGGA